MIVMQIRRISTADARTSLPLSYDDRPCARRIGLLALDSDLTVEPDLAALAQPAGLAIHVARLAFGGETTARTLAATLPRLTQAARLLPPGEALDAIGYACTSASAVLGEDAVGEAVRAGRPGLMEPVITPISAARAAMRALEARRVAILAPYLPEATAPVVEALGPPDFEVVAATCLGIADDRQMARLSVESIAAMAVEATPPEADALFISCTALRAMHAAARIEAMIGRPVVTSNLALGWALMRVAGLETVAPQAGALMGCALPSGSFATAS